jgi:small subunit ribosomal protein S2
MKFVWMFLALVIAVGVAYLIWEEYIAKREQRGGPGSAERYAEADIKALVDEARPVGQMSDADAAAALHAAVENAEEQIEHIDDAVPESEPETVAEIVAEDAGEVIDEAVAAVEDEAEVVEVRAAEVVEALDIAPDDLTKVKGIGKVYQERLNEAGIYSFAQLIEIDPAKLAEITKAIEAANVDDWARQARELMA